MSEGHAPIASLALQDMLGCVVKIHGAGVNFEGMFPAIAENRDAADELIDTIATLAGRGRDALTAFPLNNKQDITFALNTLKDLGETSVILHGNTTSRALSIDRLLAALYKLPD